VTPPFDSASPLSERRLGASRANWLVLQLLFYAKSELTEGRPFFQIALLLLQIDGLVFVPGDGGANLGRGLTQLGLLVGVEALFGAC